MRTTRITPEVMGWDTRSHEWNDVTKFFEDEVQMGEIGYNTGWRVYVSTPDGVERYDTTATGIPTWTLPVSTTGNATQTTIFYELTPEELTTEKPVQAKDADEWEPASEEELDELLGMQED